MDEEALNRAVFNFCTTIAQLDSPFDAWCSEDFADSEFAVVEGNVRSIVKALLEAGWAPPEAK